MKNNEQIIEELIIKWTQSISNGDRAGILKAHSDDILMYDFPDVVRGIKAYDKTWDYFFKEKIDTILFIPRDIEITASDTVAFASCLIRCEGTSAGIVELRLTAGFKKINHEWIFTHEHHSVPSTDDKFIDDVK
jgi:ketosteroid isomerase-like protein